MMPSANSRQSRRQSGGSETDACGMPAAIDPYSLLSATLHVERSGVRFGVSLIDNLGFNRLEREVWFKENTFYYDLLDGRMRRYSTLPTHVDSTAWASFADRAPLAKAFPSRLVDEALDC